MRYGKKHGLEAHKFKVESAEHVLMLCKSLMVDEIFQWTAPKWLQMIQDIQTHLTADRSDKRACGDKLLIMVGDPEQLHAHLSCTTRRDQTEEGSREQVQSAGAQR